MKKNVTTFFLLFAIVTLASIGACKKKQKPVCDGSATSYDLNIKAIIDSKCTGSGCHNSGSSHGDFTIYSSLKPWLDNGKFKTVVLDNQSMPKGSSLTSDQINKIMCWKENNYPEK